MPQYRTFSGVLAVLALGSLNTAQAQPGTLDTSFNPGDQGYGRGVGTGGSFMNISSMAVQPDGRVIIVGGFNSYAAWPCGRVARLEPDGTLDVTYATGSGFNSSVASCVLQPDGKLIVAGDFLFYSGSTRPNLARLNSDGSLDVTFAQGNAPDGYVAALALRTDGRVVIGGGFTMIGSTPRNDIAVLNADGSPYAGFDAGAATDGAVEAIQVQSDNKVIIAGNFTTVAGTPRSQLARLNADGSLDLTFNSGDAFLGSQVHAIQLQPDGKLLVGGAFALIGGVPAHNIVRLLTNGSADPGFNTGTGFDATVSALALQPDGKVLVSSWCTNYNGVPVSHVVRLQASGALDASYDIGDGGYGVANHMTVQPDGSVLVAGNVKFYGVHYRDPLARTLPNGALDEDFNVGYGADARPTRFVQQPDGKILMAGYFNSYNDTVCEHVLRVDLDGHIDTSFHGWGTGMIHSTAVRDLALMTDGRVVIGGSFNTYRGTSCYGVMRLLANGDPDPSFDAGTGTNATVIALAVQPDGKIIIGGEFTQVDGVPRARIARLNLDGSVDTSFDPGTGPNGTVTAMLLQPDGRVVIGGNFSSFNGTTARRLLRLMPDGSIDPSFDITYGTSSGQIYALALLPDNKILVGGQFTSYDLISTADNIVRLLPDGNADLSFQIGSGSDGYVTGFGLQPDGKIIVSGAFQTFNGTARKHIARLHANGAIDTNFDPGAGPSASGAAYVMSMCLLADGRVMIGGSFTSFAGVGRNFVARVRGAEGTTIKAQFEGPYAGGSLMNDALRTLPSFPLTEPFTAMGYAEPVYVPGATIPASVLSVTGNNAIVDWVLVEMRPVATPGTVAATRAVLLQRDGDIVDLDGMSTVGFAGLAAGSYCVAVKPRNHLPVMLSPSTPVVYGDAIAAVDFTLPATQVYDNDARKNVGGVMVLAAGDVTFNETIAYTGADNDRDPILTRIGGVVPSNTVTGYWREDVNMDGMVKYTGAANDRDIILVNIGGITPTNTRVATLP